MTTKNNSHRGFWFSAAVLSALVLALQSAPSAAQQPPARPEVLSNAVTNQPIQFDVSRPIAELVQAAPAQQQGGNTVMQQHLLTKPRGQQSASAQSPSTASPSTPSAFAPLAGPLISATIGLGFDGVSDASCATVQPFRYVPPDTNAAVGDTQVVQWVNVCYAVYDKSTGVLIAGPFPGNKFWAGFGGPCETRNDGDPIIQFDKRNHVWVAAQNTFAKPYMTCIAVSQTADVTGGWSRYAFPQTPGFPDYPKWGLTRNVYYQTQNVFNDAGTAFLGVNVCGYDARRMVEGSPATQICILDNSNGTLFDDSMLPADDDADFTRYYGQTNPEVLLGSIDNFFPGDTHVYEYVFRVDFPNNSATLTGVNGSMPITVPAFKLALCPFSSNCVPQPGTTAKLDTLGDRLMYRLAHFNDGITQHFVVTHSVKNTTAVAVRWYEFRAPGPNSTSLSLYQWGQTPDDGEYRWMGSAARDGGGDIAIGYSRSSAALGDYPSIYYAGQTAGDPLGTTETEALIKHGTGSQTDSNSRWGDYSSMALDLDLCTFWYTTEYYQTTSRFNFYTWLASLTFPNCSR